MKKFYFILVALVLGFTAGATDYMINGVGNVWTDWTKTAAEANGHLFTETSSGVYELDLNETLSGSFLIVGLNTTGTSGDWDTKIGSNGSSIKEGTSYKYDKGDSAGNLTMAGQVDNPHIKVDTNAGTLLITGQVSQNRFDVVYMIGDFGDGWNANITDYPLARVEGTDNEYKGTYTINSTAVESEYFFTVPKCGNVLLQLSGTDVVPVSGQAYTVQPGANKSFSMTPGTYTFHVTAEQDATTGVVVITPETTVPDNTIYWDNTEAGWSSLCAAVSNGTTAEDYEMSDLGNGFWSVEIPGSYTTVIFKDYDDEANTTEAYTIHNNYMYSLTNSGSEYEEPVDYSSWYVNVMGGFNSWADNGIAATTNGITTHKNLAIGTSEFKVKVWNGSADVWHSNGQAIALDTPTAIPNNSDYNMTVAGAAEGDVFDVTYNCKTNEITITRSGDIDYTGWYFNIVGDFNSWSTDFGVEFNADGTAVNTYENVNTAFKVRVYDSATDHDYAKTGTLTANEWNDVNANQDNMVLPEDLRTGAVKFTFNNANKTLLIERGTVGVDSITAEDNAEPVYYNLRGIRVDNPENGVFIVVRGDKVSKQIVK